MAHLYYNPGWSVHMLIIKCTLVRFCQAEVSSMKRNLPKRNQIDGNQKEMKRNQNETKATETK